MIKKKILQPFSLFTEFGIFFAVKQIEKNQLKNSGKRV